MVEESKNLKKICLLCMLIEKPMHGYNMMKEIERRFDKKIGSGFIYPTLSEMEEKGYIKSKTEMDGNREKKIYSLTASGKRFCAGEKECIKNILKEFF